MTKRRVAISAAVLVASIWLGGTVTALSAVSFGPNACRAPFVTWALTWPVWRVAPTSALVWLEERAFDYCEREAE